MLLNPCLSPLKTGPQLPDNTQAFPITYTMSSEGRQTPSLLSYGQHLHVCRTLACFPSLPLTLSVCLPIPSLTDSPSSQPQEFWFLSLPGTPSANAATDCSLSILRLCYFPHVHSTWAPRRLRHPPSRVSTRLGADQPMSTQLFQSLLVNVGRVIRPHSLHHTT